MHFVKTRWYERIMPPYLPRHRELVYASGVAEIAGGLATMHPRDPPSGQPLEHRHAARRLPGQPPHGARAPSSTRRAFPGGRNALYARLPVQLLFIAWAYAAGDWD